MSSNFDDDEALFDDVYADETPAVQEPQQQEQQQEQHETQEKALSPPPPPPPPPAEAEGSTEPILELNTSEGHVEQQQQPAQAASTDYSTAFAQLSQTLNQGQGQGDDAPVQVLQQQTSMMSTMPGVPAMPGFPAANNGAGAGNPMQQMQQMFQQQMQQMQQQMQQDTEGDADGKFQDSIRANLEGKDVGKMFIGGLNWETDENRLKEYFNSYGEVLEVNVMRDGATGKSRGFAFLTFAAGDSVDKVLSEKHILDGKLIDPKRAIPKDEQEKIGKVFVGGVASDVTTHDFREYFQQFGNIIDSQLMINKDTGKSRGYGFVTYDSADAVERCTREKYVMFHGKRMEVKKAEPRAQHNVKKMQDNSMNNNMMMGGGDMNQYMAQMQQMQQMWMQQMQQMQMNPDQANSMMMNPMMMGMQQQQQQPQLQQQMQPQHSSMSNSQNQYEEDDVPNPQEYQSPPSNSNSHLSGNSNMNQGSGSSTPSLPSGPKRLREKETSSFGNERRRDNGRDGGRRRPRRGGGNRRGGDRERSGGFHPYRR